MSFEPGDCVDCVSESRRGVDKLPALSQSHHRGIGGADWTLRSELGDYVRIHRCSDVPSWSITTCFLVDNLNYYDLFDDFDASIHQFLYSNPEVCAYTCSDHGNSNTIQLSLATG